MVDLLLSHNASLNVEDNDGFSPLHHAAKNGHSEVCLELIEAGAQIESTDSGDWTPLIWVSTRDYSHKGTGSLTSYCAKVKAYIAKKYWLKILTKGIMLFSGCGHL